MYMNKIGPTIFVEQEASVLSNEALTWLLYWILLREVLVNFFFFFFNWRLRSLSSMGLVIFRCYVEDEYVNPVWKAEITELMQHLVRKSYP